MSRMKSLGAGAAGAVFSTVITRQIAEPARPTQYRSVLGGRSNKCQE
jgi:hypothetical protein